jgi:hypothetical protein
MSATEFSRMLLPSFYGVLSAANHRVEQEKYSQQQKAEPKDQDREHGVERLKQDSGQGHSHGLPCKGHQPRDAVDSSLQGVGNQ